MLVYYGSATPQHTLKIAIEIEKFLLYIENMSKVNYVVLFLLIYIVHRAYILFSCSSTSFGSLFGIASKMNHGYKERQLKKMATQPKWIYIIHFESLTLFGALSKLLYFTISIIIIIIDAIAVNVYFSFFSTQHSLPLLYHSVSLSCKLCYTSNTSIVETLAKFTSTIMKLYKFDKAQN